MSPKDKALSDDIVAVPLRHPWRWVSAVILVALIGSFVYSLWASPNINHDIIDKYIFNEKVMEAALLTVVLTVISMFIGTILAVIFAVMRLSPNPVLRAVATGYVGFFRGTPLLLQVVFWGYLGIIYPNIEIGIPFTDIIWFSEKTSLVFTALIAGIIALSLNEGAYAAEIVREAFADNPKVEGISVACYHKDLDPFMARGRALRALALTAWVVAIYRATVR